MSTKFRRPANYFKFTGVAKASGALVNMGDRVGICQDTVLSTETGIAKCDGNHLVNKDGGAMGAGVAVYMDLANGNRVTTTTAGNKMAGWTAAAAAAGDATVEVELSGGSHYPGT